MTLLDARCHPSSCSIGTASHARLDVHLPQIIEAPLTLVSAPAGAGKTVALKRWASRLAMCGRRTAWLTLDPNAADCAGLFAAISASMQGICPRWRIEPPAPEVAADPSTAAILLSNAWLATETPIALFLDQLERVGPSALELVRALIDALPSNAHLLIASRTVPDLAVSRLRLFGGVIEVGLRELRFDDADMRLLFGHRLSSEQQAALLEATDGWAASLGLARRMLDQGADLAAVQDAISGRAASLAAFFDETALADVGPLLSDFLVATSFLPELEPALCNAATGRNDALAMLNAAQQSNLFIEPLNAEHTRLRLMRPFREFLERRREEAEPFAERSMCRQLVRHLLDQGDIRSALDYAALTRDREFLADLLEQHCEALTYRGDILHVVRLSALVPDDALDRLPRLLMILAWANIRHLEIPAARMLLDRARQRIQALAETDDQSDADAAGIEWLRLILLHRETMVCAAEDDFDTVETNSGILIPRLQGHSYLLCSVQAQLMVARREQYRVQDLPAIEARARAALTAQSCDFAAITLEISAGPGLMAAGRLGEATEALERGYQQAVHFAGDGSSLAALAALPLAEALYEQNDLARASELIDRHIDKARRFSFADQLISGYLTRARIFQARGDVNGALRTVEDGLKVGLERNLERLRITMVAEKIRLMLRNGQSSRAAEIASASGIQGPGVNFAPGPRPTTLDELRAMAWCRLGLSQDRVQDVIAVVKQWRRFCVTRGATRSMIRWSLLLAICLTMEGELHSARRTLRDAAGPAADGRWIRCFLDEGRLIKTLITECLGLSNLAPGAVDQFYVEVMASYGDHPAPGAVASPVETGSADLALYGRLLPRELEILSLVGTGMRNREIGTRLGLTEGTVKWYMTQIYDKVGVRRRPQAVDRARMFGLLA